MRLEWRALEAEMPPEFQKKARMHLSRDHLAQPEDKLSWLALAQHHGVPTRLLDFIYSPYVALYFALRGRKVEEYKKPPEVWAIDQAALFKVGVKFNQHADAAIGKAESKPGPLFKPNLFGNSIDASRKEG
jgi:hypothetical protein